MLTFFKINDPYRVLVVFSILLLMRLPVLFAPEVLSIPELKWMVLGQKIAQGAHLYLEVWDNTAPFSAWTYALLHLLFGRSQTAYLLVALFIVTYQCLIFNNFLISKKAYNENTYIPAVLLGLLSCVHFQLLTLSPQLMSITFVILAIRNIFHRVDSQPKDERILFTGLFLSIAALFYLPSIIFLISTLLVYLFFVGLKPRRYLLLLYGFAIPILLVMLYFFWIDALPEMLSQYVVASLFNLGALSAGFTGLLAVLGMAALLLIAAFFKLSRYHRYTNFQARYQQIVLFTLIAAAGSLAISFEYMPAVAWLFIPWAAFFGGHFLLLVKRALFAELWFGFILVFTLLSGLGSTYGWLRFDDLYRNERLLTRSTPYDQVVANQRVTILGESFSAYRHAEIATPYLNWDITSRRLKEPAAYNRVAETFRHFRQDPPEIIVDEQEIMPGLMDYIPFLRKSYRQQGRYVYRRQEQDSSITVNR